MIAAKEISRVELGFEFHQSVVVRTIGRAHAMALTLVKRINVHLTSIKWLRGIEEACDPFQIGLVFVGMIPEAQNFEVIWVTA